MFAVTVYFGHYFAAAHYDYAVGHAEDLRHFRRYHDNALALLDKAVHYVVNLDLCADVDTTGRFVKDKDLCIRVDPLADYDLLLVTTGQLAYDLSIDGVLMRSDAMFCSPASRIFFSFRNKPDEKPFMLARIRLVRMV